MALLPCYSFVLHLSCFLLEITNVRDAAELHLSLVNIYGVRAPGHIYIWCASESEERLIALRGCDQVQAIGWR